LAIERRGKRGGIKIENIFKSRSLGSKRLGVFLVLISPGDFGRAGGIPLDEMSLFKNFCGVFFFCLNNPCSRTFHTKIIFFLISTFVANHGYLSVKKLVKEYISNIVVST
jgi:hypothetical protein